MQKMVYQIISNFHSLLTLIFKVYGFCIIFLYFSIVEYAKIWWNNTFITSFQVYLSERLSNNLWGLEVSLFSEFINIVPILFCNFIGFITLFYTFLVISFSWYKEYMICLILLSKFSNVLLSSNCAWTIGNLWRNSFSS